MSYQTKWLIGLVLLIAFGILVIHTPLGMGAQATRLEERLAVRTQSQLEAAGVDWAGVDMRGQKAILTGTAPTRESLSEARRAASRAAGPGAILFGGVTKVVTTDIEIPPPFEGPYEWTARLAPTALTLQGLVPTEADADALVARAAALFPDRDIINELEVNTHTPRDDWMDLAFVGVDGLGELLFGEAVISDESLRMSGEAPDQGGVEAVLAVVDAASDRFIISTAVTAPPPPPPPAPEPEPEPEVEPEPLFSALDRFVLEQPAEPVLEPDVIEEPEPVEEPEVAEVEPEPVVEEIAPIDTAVGCQERFNLALAEETVRFAIGSARISPDSHPLLDELAAVAKACAGFTMEIEGHTDDTGSEDFNLNLSGDRALEVVEYLRAQGVPIDRMTPIGYGSAQPVAPNTTADGRRLNRRISFKVSQ